VRILYCCGLRPIEACRLVPADVDLSVGKLHIRESKGHKDRIVMMAHDVTAYMHNFDKQAKRIMPNRQWFFPNASGNICDNRWLSSTFRQISDKLRIGAVCGNKPTLYSFRYQNLNKIQTF